MISYILYFEIGDKIDGWNLIYIIVYLNVVELGICIWYFY